MTLKPTTTTANISLTIISIVIFSCCCLIERATATATADFEAHHVDNVREPKFVVISEDVIPDVENTTQKVIRVNPLDLPPIRDDPNAAGSSDSDLYKIKAFTPPAARQRNYVNSKRMRRPRPMQQKENDSAASADSPIVRGLKPRSREGKFQKPKHQQPHKQKKLHFLYHQEALDGRTVGKRLNVHIAPGAYPVYYAVSKTNGHFGKYPIKGFRNEREFQKYLLKSKLEPIALKERFAS